MGRVQDKVGIVTGAASATGIGFATARALVREGARVVLTDVDENGVKARASELGQSTIGLVHDVTNEEDWSRIVRETLTWHGRIDILVNNAGMIIPGGIDDLVRAAWDRQIEVNLSSVFLGCKAVLSGIRAQGGGAIVNISSIAGLVGEPRGLAYSAGKGGVRLLTKSLALELARENIRVNSVHPGAIATQMLQFGTHDVPGLLDRMKEAIPLGRIGHPDDIAAMVLFLASDEAKYITGAEFVVDGGLTAV